MLESWGTPYQGVIIGGQDTGYDWDHPAIKDSYRAGMEIVQTTITTGTTPYTNLLATPTMPTPVDWTARNLCDDHSHGTHTMGTMAGAKSDEDKSIGVAPGARWIACRNMEKGWNARHLYRVFRMVPGALWAQWRGSG